MANTIKESKGVASQANIMTHRRCPVCHQYMRQNEIVVIKDAQPLSQPAPLSETTTITSVHMIPPSSGINETVFEFSVAKPVTLRPAYLLSPTRLIVDFIPQ